MDDKYSFFKLLVEVAWVIAVDDVEAVLLVPTGIINVDSKRRGREQIFMWFVA